MPNTTKSTAALALVTGLHAAVIGLALWVPAPETQELVLPTLQGVLLPAPPAQEVQAPSASEPPPKVAPPVTEPPKPRPAPKPKMPVKPRTTVEPPPSERAPSQPEVATEPTAPAALPLPESNTSPGAPVTPPQMDANPMNNPAPAYPSLSRRLHEQGVVLLEILILPDGSVGEVRIRESSGYKRLDDTAAKAVKRWRYAPARRGLEPIEYWYLQPVDFSLK